MQAQGSWTDSSYGSIDSTEGLQHGPDIELSRNTARTIVESPLSRLHESILVQEDISQARKDLLVERSKARSAGEAVRSQRIVTGNIEGQFLSTLRQFYNAKSEALPRSITEAYERVIQERDRLGSIEDSYFEAERTLGGSEWRFMQKEEMLYQYHFPDLRAHMDSTLPNYDSRTDSRPPPPPDPIILGTQTVLVHNAPPPPPPPPKLSLESLEPADMTAPPTIIQFESNSEVQLEYQYKSAVMELDDLRKEFDSLRPQQSEVLDFLEFGKRRTHIEASENRVRSQILFEKYSTLLAKIAEKEVEVQHLRQAKCGFPKIDADMSRRMSDEWMLNYVKTNPMERKIYMNVLEDTGVIMPHGDSLDEWSERLWFSHATESSSGDGQDFTEAIGNRHHSNSSASSDGEGYVQTKATPEGDVRPAIQQSRQSLPLLASEETFTHFQDHEIHQGRFAHGAAKSDTAGHYSGSAEPTSHSTDVRISGRPSESLNHHRSKSNPAIFDVTQKGGGRSPRYSAPYSWVIMC